MRAKIHIAISIEKQIVSALRNRFPFVDRTSQTRDMEKRSLRIIILIPYHFYMSSLANKGCLFSLLSVGGRLRFLMGSLCIAG